MAHTTQFHLEKCPSHASGLSEDCSCAEEEKKYLSLAKLSFGIFGLELFGGVGTGSVALVSDALHVLIDGAESIVNAIVSRFSRNGGNEAMLRKLGGKISAMLLLVASAGIIYEGLERVSHPHEVAGYMVFIAIAGLGVNLYQRYLLWKAPKEHHNEQHFWQNWHLWGDISSSIAVIIGGVIMLFTDNLYWIDGVLSVGIGAWLVALTGAKLIGVELHTHKHEGHGPDCTHNH